MKSPIVDSTERFERIKKAVEERDRFLAEHPELIPFQDEIEKRLRGVGSIENRVTILRSMMEERLAELNRACLQAKESWEGSQNYLH